MSAFAVPNRKAVFPVLNRFDPEMRAAAYAAKASLILSYRSVYLG